jgi:hypothetical protein
MGYILARGDRRDYVVVDHSGGIHSLARRIDGMKAAELREFMSPLSPDLLPSISQAKEVQTFRDHKAIFRHYVEEYVGPKTQFRRSIYSEMSDTAKSELQYGKGDGYASQSQAALKDHRRRQKELDEKADAIRTFDYGQPKEQERAAKEKEDLLQRQADETTKRDQARTEIASSSPSAKEVKSDGKEMTDAKQERLSRYQETLHEDDNSRDRDDPDRQHEASGRGRTRSR